MEDDRDAAMGMVKIAGYMVLFWLGVGLLVWGWSDLAAWIGG